MPNIEQHNADQAGDGFELIIAFVAAVGVNLEIAEQAVRRKLLKNNYRVEHVKVTTDVLPKLDPEASKKFDGSYLRIGKMMDIGNRARKNHGKNIIAKGIAAQIAEKRKQSGVSSRRVAYLVHSLKHPDEVHDLRKTYPRGFYLVGVHAHPKRRKGHLVGIRRMTEDQAAELMERDKKEAEKYGQQVYDTFHLADFFVGWGGDDEIALEDFLGDTSSDSEPSAAKPNAMRVSSTVNRFIDLMFADPFRTPTFGEYAMFLAFSASLRSADLSRQVGAVIARDGEILSTGANDCPRAGGGLYWPEFKSASGLIDDAPNGRDYVRKMEDGSTGYDSNRFEQDELIHAIRDMAVQRGLKGDALSILESALFDRDNPLRNLTEYGRVVHAEMEALLACARKGISTKGATVYCTTFPCHNCAKHLIAAGIDRVVFIEPYLKSKAFDFHEDAIVISYPQDREPGPRQPHEPVQFEPFFGVGPRRFFDLFSMKLGGGEPIDRKMEGSYRKVGWPVGEFMPRIRMEPFSYLDYEEKAAAEFEAAIQKGLK